jgi:hypothetical protein
MEKFSAVTFFQIGRFLAIIRSNVQRSISTAGYSRETKLAVASAEAASTPEALQAIKTSLIRVGLPVSIKCMTALIDKRTEHGATFGDVQDAIGQLEQTISWEMEDRLFMYINPDRAARYDQRELFGKDVNSKFPTIQFDLVEAGNCYATGRSTAVVFHLMRIMETGVQAFGTKLGVKLTDEKNWQNILDEVNKAIRGLSAKDPATVAMSQASANLYAVKLAWRNEVMHPKDTYTLEEADNLIRQVKIFMEQLATII